MKKTILTLGTLLVVGCGGGSEEAKELLQRILQLVGIPQNMVVTICQDNNRDGLCNIGELQTKVLINKGDSVDSIWDKVTKNPDGTYFIEHYDPSNPILLVLKDEVRVNSAYDNSQFGLSFDSSTDGEYFYHDKNKTIAKKELSILQSMIDAGQLAKADVSSVRKMKNVDDFYKILREDLATNVNTLRGKELNAKQTIDGNIKEMAEELLANGVKDKLPQDMNNCNGDQTCIDNVLNPLSKELLITDEEAEEIANEQNKNDESDSSPTPATNSQDKLIVKKTQYKDDGTVESEDSYEYDSNNRAINHKTEDETCTYTYDSKNRLSVENCENKDNSTSKTEFFYSGDRLSKIDDYENGTLSDREEVTEWDGEKPKKVSLTSYSHDGQEGSSSTMVVTFTGKNPTRFEGSYNNGDTTYITTKKYDNKKTPYDMEVVFGIAYSWFYGLNNVTEEKTTYNSSETLTKNSITYNSGDLPTRIDTTVTSSYEGSESYEERSYTTYEYKDAIK